MLSLPARSADRAGHAADAVIAAGREAEALERLLHQQSARFVQLAEAAQLRRLHIGVAAAGRALEALALDGAGRFNHAA